MSNTWDSLHSHYSSQDWINKPNIFAEEILEYLPKSGHILCIGDGQGQDARFFASKGFQVISTDISDNAIEANKSKIVEQKLDNIKVEKLDLSQPLPYENNSFDVVYSHLSIHYFDQATTEKIFNEIKRILKPGGVLAVFTNSVNDPEFNTGKRLEQELFEIDGMSKRFFSIYSMYYFGKDFEVILLDDKGRTYKDEAKGIRNLVRFIGKKPVE